MQRVNRWQSKYYDLFFYNLYLKSFSSDSCSHKMPPKKSKKPINGDEDIQVIVQNISLQTPEIIVAKAQKAQKYEIPKISKACCSQFLFGADGLTSFKRG